ncbi:MAG: DeoR/GlpR family DNA-binding transcription regulator, partial [Clostridia bacterium]|nr:DeoR/GlpR family DNA-binding transcription regulator [Clostridia bacterium]
MDLSTERQKIILKTLDHYGKVSVNELAEKFNVASATIRRDLTALEKENKLQRVHGGAIKISFYAEEPAITKRRSMYMIEKIKIAKIASRIIEDKMSVFIDVGTTTAQIIPFLKERRNLQVLTNSLEALMELVKMVNNNTFHGKIIFIGGEINAKQLTVSGSLSEGFINQFFVDIAFIGVGGVHLSGGLTGYDE